MLTPDNIHPLVLVVEDEPLVRMDITLALVDAGFSVIEVPDADEALELLESRNSIRLVFTDVELPGTLNGLDLAHTIKARWPQIAVLVTSGRVTVEDEDADLFIPKPYDTSMVIDQARSFAV
ncbi:response regulator [Pelagibacterium luteolum]|uniref:response regulator n=1 Tax=Pelagibacterium luteolum TaxID=440168 RepID=UPI001FCCE130|nr:response regulator [Pelagibacterium luteolum]